MRLVVCVDRDDDLGRKAGVAGPVIGREAVLDAAVRLGSVDPEDSDMNALFAAIRLLDELRESGETAEVVALTGSPKVGVLSDRRVAEQFDRVLSQFSAVGAFLVSDGAEDEYLFPILSSRLRIDGVRRVYVRQNASIESTYYTVTRALKDPKLRAKTVLPLALVLIILGFAAWGGVIWWGVIGLIILLGFYLILWTFDLDEAIIDALRSASTDIRQGSVAFGFGLFALALVGIGFLSGYNSVVGHPGLTPIARVLEFMLAGLVFWFVGAFVWECGRALRRYFLHGRMPRSFLIASTSIAGIGLVSYGIVFSVMSFEGLLPVGNAPLVVGTIVGGLGLVVGAGILQQYFNFKARASAARLPESSSSSSTNRSGSG